MPKEINDLPPPVNHVFVDFENVHEIEPAVIGSKTVHFTLLLGSRQTKLDVALVEKLLRYAANVELVRLKFPGRNALDFALAYYLGRAVLADPSGYFHIVSKDKGYDALVEHLRSKHFNARRHDSFATFPFANPAAPSAPCAPTTAPTLKSPTKARPPSLALKEQAVRVLAHLRKPSANRPRTKNKLVSFLVAHLGHKITETEALELVNYLSQTGHLTIGEKGTVTFSLGPK